MRTKSVCTLLIAVLWLACAATGTTITFSTPVGSSLDGQPVSASATLTTAEDLLTLQIFGLWANPTSIIQALSDVAFSIDRGLVATGIVSSSGEFVDIASGGSFTSLGTGSTGWLLDSTGLRLCVLCAGAAGPSQLIIGQPDQYGVYSNANGSIAANQPHNPFLQADANVVTFALSVPGLTEGDSATVEYFSFGTQEGKNVPTGEVPEGATLYFVGGGLLALARGMRRWRARKAL